MIYESADAAVKRMNRQNLKLFNTLKLAKFDEISLIRAVGNVYDQSVNFAKQNYYEMAVDAYIAGLMICGFSTEEASRRCNQRITHDWILDMLEEVDDIMLYRFMEEADRKKQRLAEALSKALNRNAEVDKALRAWTGQIAQFALNAVDRARMQAFRDAGVTRVMWHTEADERVCHECAPLDGRIFDIDAVPRKPHPRCRCWLTPVFDESYDRLRHTGPNQVMAEQLIA